MNDVMEGIRRLARSRPQRLLFAEAEDERIVRAADRVARDGIARVGFVGPRDRLKATARACGVTLGDVEAIDAESPGEVARTLAELRASRGDRLSAADAERYSRDPLFQAAARVRAGLADCFVAGASRTTADVLRATLWLVGLEPGVRTLSSFFLMVVPGTAGAADRVFLFADCAVVPDPTAEQLAEIGIMAADAFARLARTVPHTAFLSFATRGSAEHPHVEKVRQACALARSRRADLHFDGELQLDAAIVPDVAKRKAPDSVVAGHANVLVFPDLDAGNIGYKLVQRFAGARAYGPILMGPAKQANDLSRGCTAEEVAETATIACAVSGARAGLPA
jgi:phosphate acetyltransferase